VYREVIALVAEGVSIVTPGCRDVVVLLAHSDVIAGEGLDRGKISQGISKCCYCGTLLAYTIVVACAAIDRLIGDVCWVTHKGDRNNCNSRVSFSR
jgi:hypothetical protein